MPGKIPIGRVSEAIPQGEKRGVFPLRKCLCDDLRVFLPCGLQYIHILAHGKGKLFYRIRFSGYAARHLHGQTVPVFLELAVKMTSTLEIAFTALSVM
jgi:hypothetical protein